MNDQIIKALYSCNDKQAQRLVAHFKSVYGECDGSQYSKIITRLNAVYKKEHSDDELKNIVTDGNGDGGLADAIVFTKDSCDIFEIKEQENLKLRDIQQLGERFRTLIVSKTVDYSQKDCSRIKAHLKKIHSVKYKREKYKIYIFRKMFEKFNEAIEKEIKKIEDNPGVEVIFLDNEKISALLLEQDFLKEWQILGNTTEALVQKKKTGSSNEYQFLILKIRLADLLKLYKTHLEEKKDLFDRNIRLPKKVEKFSNGISQTINDRSENFFLFHNGITITANKIKANASSFIISEPQVVNGAQTLGNLFKKYSNNIFEKKLIKATVICKIIEADQDLTDLICETSNTQKAVKVEDLRTNDSFQRKLELYIKYETQGKYSYERKGEKGKTRTINIQYVKFFQWAYSALFLDPANAKNARKNLFEKDSRGQYEKIKNSIEKNLSKVVLLCDIGTFVESQIKKEKSKKRKGLLRSSDLHIIAGLFLLQSVKKDDFDKINKLLKNYSDKKIHKDKSMNNNKIFTKSNEAWKFLLSRLKKSKKLYVIK